MTTEQAERRDASRRGRAPWVVMVAIFTSALLAIIVHNAR